MEGQLLLSILTRRTDRYITAVENFPDQWNLDVVLRDYKSAFRCNGCLMPGRIIHLQGDQRQNVVTFSLQRGLTADNIVQT